jgi:hypothetical protein
MINLNLGNLFAKTENFLFKNFRRFWVGRTFGWLVVALAVGAFCVLHEKLGAICKVWSNIVYNCLEYRTWYSILYSMLTISSGLLFVFCSNDRFGTLLPPTKLVLTNTYCKSNKWKYEISRLRSHLYISDI